MDDFRLGSILRSDPVREQGPSDSANRQKRPRKRISKEGDRALKEDEFVTSPGPAEAGEEPIEDSYSPSHPTEESE